MKSEEIGKSILDVRKKNKLTQKAFADILHVTYQAVSKWETGKSIPDIGTLNLISKTFNVDLNEIINGEKKDVKKRNIIIFIIIGVLIIIAILSCYLLFHKHNDFEFKTISSTCSEFKITGSAAYNQDKTSIYISNIDYCGGDDNKTYESINYVLYSTKDNENKIITKSTNSTAPSTLAQYLKDIIINVQDYSNSCSLLSNNNLYLEINAQDANNKITTYKVYLELKDNC